MPPPRHCVEHRPRVFGEVRAIRCTHEGRHYALPSRTSQLSVDNHPLREHPATVPPNDAQCYLAPAAIGACHPCHASQSLSFVKSKSPISNNFAPASRSIARGTYIERHGRKPLSL